MDSLEQRRDFTTPETQKPIEYPGQKVILEIGVGSSPYFLSPAVKPEDRVIREGQQYIGIDTVASNERANPEWIKGNSVFINAKGDRLPMKESSVPQVVLNNFFSSPYYYFHDQSPENYRDFISTPATQNYLFSGKALEAAGYPVEAIARYSAWGQNILEVLKKHEPDFSDIQGMLRELRMRSPHGSEAELNFYQWNLESVLRRYQTLDSFVAALRVKIDTLKEVYRVLEPGGRVDIYENRGNYDGHGKPWLELIAADPRFQVVATEYNYQNSDMKFPAGRIELSKVDLRVGPLIRAEKDFEQSVWQSHLI